MSENELSSIIIGLGIKVHSHLGPGLLESAYEECLCYELKKEGFKVERQKRLPIKYYDVELDRGYVLDLVVEDKVIVELKSVASMTDIHLAQIMTYLKLGKYKLGLLINFNEVLLKHGIKRVVNNL